MMYAFPEHRGYPDARTIEAETINLGCILEFSTMDDSRNAFADLPALLASAPHRMMFFAGASAIIVSMLWWACELAAAYFGFSFPTTPVPPGWAHAVFTQFGMLPFFIFGFLLTVFPRWLGQPALRQRHYVPVFIGVFGGYLLSHVGLLDVKPLLLVGMLMMVAGWAYALTVLGHILIGNGAKDRTALSCYSALVLGFVGLCAFTAFSFGESAALALAAIKIGTFGLLLPIYFTVLHRMLPFFSASAIGPGYKMVKPAWSLPVFWLLALLHLGLELTHRPQWLWLADAPLAVFFLVHWLRWQPWKCMRPGLLAVLHIAAAWLPIALGLYAAQSLLVFFDAGLSLGRAPVHALTIGFFGSTLVAMVTRVTQGHSGRPLEMGRIPWLTFVLLQAVVVIRVFAELAENMALWLVVAAFAWLVAFLPWVVRSIWIFTTPRIDGKPG
ncbi:MAG TPA: NnrS family protein [Dokdonella sp.]|uniref:NnrS family protein n=1 Tax=Dokdonella sp. TaxID=2291710 RepID=UPI002D7EB52B|nr:NnrS family protein [Dokdonella sp.]HET9033099.1 NnrS family protein [Dokdonella sp.]